jgi:hypothetical protein
LSSAQAEDRAVNEITPVSIKRFNMLVSSQVVLNSPKHATAAD